MEIIRENMDQEFLKFFIFADPENTFLSFSNPNYRFEDQLKMKSSKLHKEAYHNDSNIYNEVDPSSMSLLDNKSVSDKYSNESEKQQLLGDLSVDSSSSSEEEETESENKELKQNMLKNEKNLMKKEEKNSQEGSKESGKKSTGFLEYYSMLESKAKEKSQSVSSDLDLELEWSGITSPVNQTKVKLASNQYIVIQFEYLSINYPFTCKRSFSHLF